jgi:hypothetical protein
VKRDSRFWAAVGFLLGLAAAASFRCTSGVLAGRGEAQAQLGQTNRGVLAIAERVVRERGEVLDELATMVSVRASPGPSHADRVRALELLGELHASTPGVVNAVMGQLDLTSGATSPRPIDVPPLPWEGRPGLGALLRVGLPCVAPLIQGVRTQEGEAERQRCLFDLNLLVGEHGRSWLAQAIRQEQGPAAEKRLQDALGYRFYGSGAYSLNVWFFQMKEDASPWYRASR